MYQRIFAFSRQCRSSLSQSQWIRYGAKVLLFIGRRLKVFANASTEMLRYPLLQCKYWVKKNAIRNKDTINVAFQMVHASAWKLGYLYSLLERTERFRPYVVICPHFPCSEEVQRLEFQECETLCRQRGYEFFETIQKGVNVPLNKTGMPKADIVFMQNSWERTLPQYKINAWSNALPCYVPYFFTMNILDKANYAKPFHKKLWRHFLESEWHEETARRYKRWYQKKNTYVSGYPGLDRFFLPEPYSDPWRAVTVSAEDNRKRIIYAPHHTISSDDAGLAYSTFEKNGWYMLELAMEYSDRCIFAFKPHPLLYDKLLESPEWGKTAADRYWEYWESLDNAFVVWGDYEDLFNTSDAMIHDCNSFLAEYLSTGKPTLFLMADSAVDERTNQFGKVLLNAHYKANEKEDIRDFLDTVVLNGFDKNKELRKKVVQNNLISNGSSASYKIFNHINIILNDRNN